MGVKITGTVILSGSVEWEVGTTYNTDPIVALPTSPPDETLKPMAPVPYPPPSGPPAACTSIPSPNQKVKFIVNPNEAGHTIGGVPMVSMGAMGLQHPGNNVPCQPITFMGTTGALTPLPVVTEPDLMIAIGPMNGAGITPP
jgi:hypothetical protein